MMRKIIILYDKNGKKIREFESKENAKKIAEQIGFYKNHIACIPNWLDYKDVVNTVSVKSSYK